MSPDCVALQNLITAKSLECSQLEQERAQCQTELTSMWMMYMMFCMGTTTADATEGAAPVDCCSGSIEEAARTRAEWLLSHPDEMEAWRLRRMRYAAAVVNFLQAIHNGPTTPAVAV